MLGLKSCYAQIIYSQLPIHWDTFPFDSYQSTTGSTAATYTQTKNFIINNNAQDALLFLGVGSHTRSITVDISNGTAKNTIYPKSTSIPFVLDLTQYDTTHIFTYTNGTPKPGNYSLNLTVTPSLGYESGDLYANIQIFLTPH